MRQRCCQAIYCLLLTYYVLNNIVQLQSMTQRSVACFTIFSSTLTRNSGQVSSQQIRRSYILIYTQVYTLFTRLESLQTSCKGSSKDSVNGRVYLQTTNESCGETCCVSAPPPTHVLANVRKFCNQRLDVWLQPTLWYIFMIPLQLVLALQYSTVVSFQIHLHLESQFLRGGHILNNYKELSLVLSTLTYDISVTSSTLNIYA